MAGCGVSSPHRNDPGPASAPVAVVAAPLEPAAQFDGSKANYVDGALVGAAGGAGVGAPMTNAEKIAVRQAVRRK